MGEKKENVHSGHRQRMRKRFIERGFEGMEPHEILEMVLYYGVPRRDTNELAHRLLDRYGSFANVCDASVDVLQKDFGLSEPAAVLLHMLPQLAGVYMDSRLDAKTIDACSAADILRPKFVGATSELVVLALSDPKDRLLYCDVISKGSLTSSDFPLRKVVELALRYNARYAFIAHNHPSGLCAPSKPDLIATRNMSQMLEAIRVTLVDHYIFSQTEHISLRSNRTYSSVF